MQQWALVLIPVVLSALTGCGSATGSNSTDASLSPTAKGPAELDYCASVLPYANSVQVTGTAQYIRREIFGDAVSGGGLGSANPADPSHPATVHPIRYAEVRVTDNSGTLIQCGETAADGTFSLTVPQGAATYTLAVNARAQNSHLYASILDQTTSNKLYSLGTSFTALAPVNVGTLTAAANGAVLGGAFNILDQLLNANEYLVAQVGNCAASFQLCSNYDPSLHKVSVYWQRGFNPNDYFGAGGGGLSFYLPGYSRLFILGGMNGDTDNSDTDHFDNSVIIHEYGHFLEDNWLKTDSPGGAHDGDELLDPRLAWSEGWGDFIQAAVRGESHYIDSLGNVDGSTELAFYVDTETASSGSDFPEASGEGNFREFAVTRLLWDAIDSTPGETAFGATDDISGRFNEIWSALTKTQFGYRDPAFAFRNVGLFHRAQMYMQQHPMGSDAPASNWVNIAALNRHERGNSHYAQYLVPSTGGACASAAVPANANAALPGNSYYFQLTPAIVAGDNGTLATSNLFQNNRFYHLHIDSSQSGAHALQLVYQDDDGSSALADLDLYLYDSKARFAVSGDMLGYSRAQPVGGTGVLQTETVQATLAAGDYLINVNVYTGQNVGTTADYNLVLDGVVLCPGNLVPQ